MSDPSSTRIFLTGATGLVGSYLVEQLLLAGYPVNALARKQSKIDRLLELQSKFSNLKIITAELSERNKLADAMAGSRVVIHAAASIAPLATLEEVSVVNVDGTRSVAEAAITAGVTQLIHVSSLSVIMGATHIYDASESAPYMESREAYANSKIAAEKLVLEKNIQDRIKVTVLRPGFIYGPSERAWMPRVIQMLQQRRAMLVGDGLKETNVIYVGNLCRGIMNSILRENAYGEIYNLTDGQKVSKKKLFDTIADNLGLPRVAWYIPEWFAHFLVDSACLIAPISPGPIRNVLAQYSRPALRLAAYNQGFNISKAERELDYVDRIPFEEGMARTCSAWKKAADSKVNPVRNQAVAN
ncbi:MAG TPA: NAD-dependent epimerase/dehydratase family protein [Drouetiella sp.]